MPDGGFCQSACTKSLFHAPSQRENVVYAAKLLTVSEYQYATEKYNADTEKQQARLEAAKREKAECTEKFTPVNKWFPLNLLTI
jgi:hypothetical protein